MTIAPERLAEIEKLTLEAGGHEAWEHGACVMEAVAYVAGEEFSDHPKCASPVLGAFLRSQNDSMNDEDRQMLKPYIPRLVGTKGSKAQEAKRAWMATDWLVRECAPAFLRLAGLTEQAEALEGLAALTTPARAKKAQPVLDDARKDAAAAGDAAWDAARDAAWDAAWDAAGAAARAAAWDAAGDAAGAAARAAAGAAAWDAAWAAAWAAAWDAARAAARAAAWDAARDAAWDAARAALESTTKPLQQSALLLLDRMIEVKPGASA